MSKKFGDHGQAVTACRSKLSYKRFVPTNSNNNVQIISEESNGIHAFLSFDRVAVVSAIYYGAPIVIFTNHYGALIFLSKTLKESVTTPKTKLDSIKLSIERKEKEHSIKFNEVQKLENGQPLNTKIDAKIYSIKDSLGAIQTYIQEIYNYLLSDDAYHQHARGDIVYQSLLSILFMSRTFINFYMTNIVENSFGFMEIEVSEDTYDTWKKGYDEHIKKQNQNEETEVTIKSDIENRIKFLNDITTMTNQLQNNISNYIIIENVENGLNQIASIINSTVNNNSLNNDPYKKIYNVMSQLKIASTTKERFDSCNPYSGTQNPRYWRSKLKKESYQTPLGVSLCLPDFVVITENIDDYVFKQFTLSTEPLVQKNVTFSIIFTIILNKLYNRCQDELKIYLYVSFGLKEDEETGKMILDTESRCSLNLKSIVDKDMVLEETINFEDIDNVEQKTSQTVIEPEDIDNVEQKTSQTVIEPSPNDGTAPEPILSVNEIVNEERTGGFIREPYNLRSQVRITRSGAQYGIKTGGKKNRKKRMKRTKRRKTIKKRRTKRKRKIHGGSETQTQTQTTTTKTEFDNLSSEQLQERKNIILEDLNRYPKNFSDIGKLNLQRELIKINNRINKMGKEPVTQTYFPGVGKKIGDSSPSMESIINNSIRNITRLMKQNKVVREANPMDRLTKSFDKVIRRTHILKQCEVALTIIGKFILIYNPNLMKDSESKPQNGGNINDIAEKIKTIKKQNFNLKESNETNGFDDTHPFTLLESMINYNELLNVLSNFFIDQYDWEMKSENSENTKNEENYQNILNTIINVMKSNKNQLDASYKIQENTLLEYSMVENNENVPKYPEIYDDDIDNVINTTNENIQNVINTLNDPPKLRRSTRKKNQAMMMTTDKKGNLVYVPTSGYK
jgi:hypothetical protein